MALWIFKTKSPSSPAQAKVWAQAADQLTQAGASVLLNDINETLAKDVAKTMNNCIGVGGDVGDLQVVQNLVKQAVTHFGKLDMLIANAGLTLWGDFFNYKPEDFERVVGVNLRGSFFLAQAAAKQMREQKTAGRIVLMSSVTGHQAVPFLSAYGMTKAGLKMLARNLVVELSPHNITINCVAPG